MKNIIFIILLELLIILLLLYKDRSEKFTQQFVNKHTKHYIINLEKRSDRIEHIKNQIHKYDIDFIFFPATDGNTLDINKLHDQNILTKHNNINRKFRYGEIGCYLSHLGVWNEFLQDKNKDVKYAVIYEDDFILHDDYDKNLEKIIEESNEIDWDVIYLGRNCVKHYKKLCINGKYVTENLFIPNKIGYGTFGYLINKKSAKKLIDNALPMLEPSDDYILRLNNEGIINCFTIKNDLLTYTIIGSSDTYESE